MWSPRDQSDRLRFAEEWRLMLEQTPNLDFYQEMVKGLLIENNQVVGIKTSLGIQIKARTVVLTNGTFLNGLIHIGDITWDEKVKDPTHLLKKGQVVKYIIIDVNRETQRISCGLKQLTENPFESIKKKYPVGVIITGKIKSVVSFGIFVELEPGYEGLVHVSQIPDGKNIKLEEIYKAGETIKAVVLKIEPDSKKISLSIKDFDKALEKEEMSRYLKQDDSPSHGTLGSFINLQNK